MGDQPVLALVGQPDWFVGAALVKGSRDSADGSGQVGGCGDERRRYRVSKREERDARILSLGRCRRADQQVGCPVCGIDPTVLHCETRALQRVDDLG
jgi:hypothetical protein